jgi:hypothetical protein
MRRFAICVVFVILAATVKAQFDTATVLGTVIDPSGAVVPRCHVSLRNTSTAIVQTALTDELGQFRFIDVPAGPYQLQLNAQGFAATAATFEVAVGARQRVDVQLKVASANTSVTATAEAAQLETDSSEHGQVVAEREIAELPLNGREYSQLVELSTGVIPSPNNQLPTYLSRDGSFNINGLRSVYTNYLLDGIDNNFYGTSNQGFSNQVVQLSPDAVAEFQVVTNNESAEYGRAGGATINAMTRYGTNEWHGRVWEFLRNTDLNAEGFFKPDVGGKPALHRNQFGGTLGGPIKKDKLFFFIDYEGFRQTQSFTDRASLPSCAERGQAGTTTCGAALGYYLIDDQDPATVNPLGYLPVDNPCNYNVGRNPCNSLNYFGAGLGAAGGATQAAVGGTQYLNGQIPNAAVIPFAAALLSYLPSPTNTSEYNNYVVLHPQSYDKDKGDAKVDFTPRENLRLFVRYSQSRMNATDPGTLPGLAGDDGDGHVFAPIKQIVGGATWTISPVSVLEARFGFSQMQAGKTPVLAGGASMQTLFGIGGLPTDPKYTGGVTYQYFLDGGFTNLGRQWTNPQYQNPTLWDPKVNYTRLVRSHSLKAGVEYTVLHVGQEDLHPTLGGNAYDAQISGYCYYNGCYAAYSRYLAGTQTPETFRMFDYADFLQGYQAEVALASPEIANLKVWGAAGYLQDDWKVNRRLALNLGLRYEFNTPIYEADNHMANYNPTTQAVVTASSSNKYLVNPNTKDFGPRIGAAYTLTPNTVLRGGFGISYSHWNRVGSNYLTMSPPFGIVAQRLAYPSLSTYVNVQSGFPSSLVSSTSYNPTEVVVQYMPANSPDTQVRSWFFSVQRDLTHNWLFDLSYVGNHGLNEVIVNDINQDSPQTNAACNTSPSASNCATLLSREPNPNYGTIAGILPWATSDYDGLQAKVEKRFSQGLYLLESFTWSKAIDIAAQALDGGGNCDNCGNGIPSVQNIYNWKADRGISAYNHPLVNTTTVVWSVPVGKGQWLLPNAGRALDTIVGGWQATGIVMGRSGDPLTFAYSPSTYGEVSALITVDGRNSYRPNQSGPAGASSKSYKQYLNTANFSTPLATSPFGTSPRNAVRGYDYWDVDMGLTKDFAITERTHFQFRAEAFNLFNHTNFGDPNTLYGAGTFGEITSSLPARELQVAGKITF